LASFFAADDTTSGIGGFGRVADHFNALRIASTYMPGLMNDEDRNILRHLIQFFLCRRTKLLQLRIVIAEPHDEVRTCHSLLVCFGPGPQRVLDIGDAANLTVGWRQHVGAERLQSAHHHVAMGIEKTGQHGAPAEIDHLRRIGLEFHHVRRCPGSQNTPALDGYGLNSRVGIVHGEDRTARVDRIRGVAVLRHSLAGNKGGRCGQQKCPAVHKHCGVPPIMPQVCCRHSQVAVPTGSIIA